MSSILRLTEQLISHNAMPPGDADCHRIKANRQQAPGFDCETTDEGPAA